MSFKRLYIILVAIVFMTSFGTVTYATPAQPEYAITDDAVIIDSVSYEIVNNTIQYNGKTYEINDYTLVTYDEDGVPTYLVLPVEQNQVTDPEMIATLNAIAGEINTLEVDFPSSYVNLPYSANVPQGQWDVITPGVLVNNLPIVTLQITNLPWTSDGRFAIIYAYRDLTGTWTQNAQITQDFSIINFMRFLNFSGTDCGVFFITNLYDNPSPAYTYNIFMSAA